MRSSKSFYAIALVSVLASLPPALPTEAADSADRSSMVAGNTQFACGLYGKLAVQPGNLFLSPYSISTCLDMVWLGARGDTEKQMAAVLHLSGRAAQGSSQFVLAQSNLLSAQTPGRVELKIANALWSQNGHSFLPEFLNSAKFQFDAKLNQADFAKNPEPARKEINDWVSHQTEGYIKDLLMPGVLDSSTRMVLVNAIYFKGQWRTPFAVLPETNKMSFWKSATESWPATFMNVKSRFTYTGDLPQVQLLELPYVSNRLSMIIILPKMPGGLSALESQFDANQLSAWLTLLRASPAREVDVTLPKFKMTSQFSLAKTLQSMGMTDAFTTKADFSGMDGAHDLMLSAVVHKAFVQVDEQGTVAAAATGAAVALLAVRPQPVPVFRADHPFLFLIQDIETGDVLFLGRLTKPE